MDRLLHRRMERHLYPQGALGRAPPGAPCGLSALHEAGAFPIHPRNCLSAQKRRPSGAGHERATSGLQACYFVLPSLPPCFAPVPGTPVSGEPTVPGPPEALVLGELPEAPDVAPEVAPPAPGMTPTPGDPDVAVPGEPEPEVEGRSAWLLTERSALPDVLAPDLDECMPDEDEEPASPDVAPCA